MSDRIALQSKVFRWRTIAEGENSIHLQAMLYEVEDLIDKTQKQLRSHIKDIDDAKLRYFNVRIHTLEEVSLILDKAKKFLENQPKDN